MSQESHYHLETPENVEVDFELAGPGSRFCALAIDQLWVSLLLLVLFGVLFCTGAVALANEQPLLSSDNLEWNWLTWSVAILIVIGFLIFFGYSLFFELILRGQTPGKRAMKIRVIRDDGTPMTAVDALIRNLLRLVDFLPAFYAMGGAVSLLHPMNKRLGDLAAGTIVVKEAPLDYRAATDKTYKVELAPSQPSNSQLTPEERRIISGFLQRRVELTPPARQALAQRLAEPLHAKYGGQFESAESYLERLLGDRHHAS